MTVAGARIERRQLGSFLKWAGGKRWLTAHFPDLFPEDYNSYHEPFVGGGSVFFSLHPSRGQISDSNSELINLYLSIRRSPADVQQFLRVHASKHSDDYFYRVRASKPKSDTGRAARMLYLNRTCWNGLYRVNQRGEFNVPRGTKNKILLDDDDFQEAATRLRKVRIRCCDFERTIDQADAGDFVFIDPPYTVSHNNNGFIKYNESLFTWADQIRLCEAVKRAKRRRVKVLITNADHGPIREMYRHVGDILRLPRASIISGSAAGRKTTSELAVRINYR